MEKEVDKVKNKFGSLRKSLDHSIDEQIAAIDRLQRSLVETPGDGAAANITREQVGSVAESMEHVSCCVTRLATEHRDLHSSVSKVGKAIDRNFVADFDCTSREEVFSGAGKASLLTDVILQHLYREGKLEIGETLSRESGITQYHDIRGPFIELNNILEALRCRDLGPVLDWVAQNREALHRRGTTLLFSEVNGVQSVKQKNSLELRLHKLKFVELLRQGKKVEAIRYARQNFPVFVSGQEREVTSLMGAVMYSGAALQQSPYADLLAPSQWQVCNFKEYNMIFLVSGHTKYKSSISRRRLRTCSCGTRARCWGCPWSPH